MAFFTLRGLAGMEWNGMGWVGWDGMGYGTIPWILRFFVQRLSRSSSLRLPTV